MRIQSPSDQPEEKHECLDSEERPVVIERAVVPAGCNKIISEEDRRCQAGEQRQWSILVSSQCVRTKRMGATDVGVCITTDIAVEQGDLIACNREYCNTKDHLHDSDRENDALDGHAGVASMCRHCCNCLGEGFPNAEQ